MNMKLKYILIISSLLICNKSLSQDYLKYDRKGAKWELKNWIKKERIKNYNFVETDSSITLQLRDTAMVKEDLYLHFNAKGLCDEVNTFAYNCVSCLMLDLKRLKISSKFGWKEVDSTFYYSKPARKVTLKVEPSKVDSTGILILKQFPGTKKEYINYIDQFKKSKK
jgi:hypothetical protein